VSSGHFETLVLEWVRQNWHYSSHEALQIYRQLDDLIGATNCLGFVLSEETDRSGPISTLSLEIEADLHGNCGNDWTNLQTGS
jgi:hypothetical protein